MQRLVVIGASAGGVTALRRLLAGLVPTLCVPIVIVLHIREAAVDTLVKLLGSSCALPVSEASGGELILDRHVYVAPGGYHLLIERNGTFALSVDEKVCYSRPSIDVLFSSAADACGAGATGVLLTGSNEDGARGLADIRNRHGLAYVQDPKEAEAPQMPAAALKIAGADAVAAISDLARILNKKYAA